MKQRRLLTATVLTSSFLISRSLSSNKQAFCLEAKKDNFISKTIKPVSTMFGQIASTSQFYLYGRQHCTATGYEEHKKSYEKPDILESKELNLKDKIYLITGANSGCGREITKYLASKGATLYMVCRNKERAFKAREEIIAETQNNNIHVLLCDCSLEADVRRMWDEFTMAVPTPHLDGLVCNAGLLANEKTLTSEGVEITLAVHLLFGTYLLTKLALPYLQATPDSKVVAVSSGGMYNTKFPSWDIASATGKNKYDGQFAYAYAKRGQVLLMGKWSELYPSIKFLSCHPGWVQTEAVDAAYGENKKYLQPLRTPWQGSEGIIYLLLAESKKLEGGGFYLDRIPCVKHMAGPFFTEGSFTKNTPEEVQTMMEKLEQWSSVTTRPSAAEITKELARSYPLKPTDRPIDIQKFMGDWFVLANIPTPFEVGATNCIEHYDWDAINKCVNITFTYRSEGAKTDSISLMKATIKNEPINSQWAMNPKLAGFYLPLGLTYLIPYISEDESLVLVGVPDRSYLWIMTRKRPLPASASEAVQFLPLTTTTSSSSSSSSQPVEAVTAANDVTQLPVPPVTTTATATTATSTSNKTSSQDFMLLEEQEHVLKLAMEIAADLGFKTEKIQKVKWTSTGTGSTTAPPSSTAF